MIMLNLTLKELNFGKTDAYNEYISIGTDQFKKMFYIYPSWPIDGLLNGSIYYICGDKGTGKTMLLKYLELQVLELSDANTTVFVRFKKDIDEDARNELKRTSISNRSYEEELDNCVQSDSLIDSKLAWQVYLIKTIVFQIERTESGIIDRTTGSWKKLLKVLKLIYPETVKKNILPKVKKGKIEIAIASFLKIGLELEWSKKDKTGVPFALVAKEIIKLYSDLQMETGRIYVLIDELELSLNKNKIYERDIALIRDLIISVQYLSEISKKNKYNIYFIAAIRNEVYKSLLSSGFELNKVIHDFGFQITWRQKGGNIDEHPLIQMIEQRISASEKEYGIDSGNIWGRYFTQSIGNNNTPIKNYILDQTWLKPRDIVRLLTFIQKQYPNKTVIDQACFDGVRQSYAEESWIEFTEELRTKYNSECVEGIKQCLIGLNLPFSQNDFLTQIEKKRDMFAEVDHLAKQHPYIGQVLRDLYDVGIIGNYPPGRFTFLGDTDVDPTLNFTLHYPLIRFFKGQVKSYKYKKYENKLENYS